MPTDANSKEQSLEESSAAYQSISPNAEQLHGADSPSTGRDDAIHTWERGGARRQGPPGGPLTACRLGPAHMKSLACGVGTWLAGKSKRQAHLWHRCCRMEHVMPFLGAKGAGREGNGR